MAYRVEPPNDLIGDGIKHKYRAENLHRQLVLSFDTLYEYIRKYITCGDKTSSRRCAETNRRQESHHTSGANIKMSVITIIRNAIIVHAWEKTIFLVKIFSIVHGTP